MLFFYKSCPPVLQDGLDVAAAALNAIKGRPMAMDLFSILQDEKRSFSFLAQFRARGVVGATAVGGEIE